MLSLLSACGTRLSNEEGSADNTYLANDCIEREARTVAALKVDIDTAAMAVIAKCSEYTDATRRDLSARFPGYRDYMAPKLRELDQTYLDRARLAVAVARTAN
jgi:hypothetical protein